LTPASPSRSRWRSLPVCLTMSCGGIGTPQIEQDTANRLRKYIPGRPRPASLAILRSDVSKYSGGTIPITRSIGWPQDTRVFVRFSPVGAIPSLGEITPKNIAAQVPERWALVATRPIWLLAAVMAPLSWLIERIADAVVGRAMVGAGPGGEAF